MPESHDLAFSKAAQAQKLLTAEQAGKLNQAQILFSSLKISKSFATIVVEANWIPEGKAAAIVGSIAGHPPLAVRRSSLPLEAAAQTAAETGKIDAETLERIEGLHAALDRMGVPRSLGEIAADMGLVKVDAPAAEPRKGTSVRTKAPTSIRAGTGSRAKPPAPPPPKKKSHTPIVLGAAGAAVLLLIVVLILATRRDDRPVDPPVVDKPPPATTKAPPPVVTTKEAPPPEDPEAVFQRELAAKREKDADTLWRAAQDLAAQQKWKEAWAKLDELKRTFGSTELCKANGSAIDTLASDAEKQIDRIPPPADPATSAAPPPVTADREALKADYEKHKRERAANSRKRLDDAKKAIETERAAEKAKMADLLKRLAGQKLALALRQGLKLDNASITHMAKDTVRLSFESDGAQAEMDIPWEALDDKSYVALQKAIYQQDGAAGWYEVGRQCITRKMWKDAKAAFDQCKKLDASFGDRIPDLDPILKNQGAFKGASKRIGRDQLVLTYDWRTSTRRRTGRSAAARPSSRRGGSRSRRSRRSTSRTSWRSTRRSRSTTRRASSSAASSTGCSGRATSCTSAGTARRSTSGTARSPRRPPRTSPAGSRATARSASRSATACGR
jgi:hypothetical protein